MWLIVHAVLVSILCVVLILRIHILQKSLELAEEYEEQLRTKYFQSRQYINELEEQMVEHHGIYQYALNIVKNKEEKQ